MKRNAIIIKESFDGSRSVAVDEDNAEELLNFFRQDNRYKKKFNHICELILGNHVNRELYDKEEPDDKSKGVRAMKFFKGQENARVYCKEINTSDKTCVIVAAEVLKRKKQTKLTHKEINIIHRVASYEYETIK
ncbi:hypothetical protein DYD21_18400 [Rhodohalobacter sp. SW132]|uniref:hypothetical protein n=1 Tax=Rhodohalobacter sp. SW132 TaxID=2293433 RepID=UPI000E282AF5|nr:hypothetical protein [Rhodohalobacter sp. SW132]REL24559.1 hypothetical protein DYD21_18400 [Rhodohalobacter sp. SW132]